MNISIRTVVLCSLIGFVLAVCFVWFTLAARGATTNQVQIEIVSVTLTNSAYAVTLKLTNTVPGEFYVIEQSAAPANEPRNFVALLPFTASDTQTNITFSRPTNTGGRFFRVFKAQVEVKK
jgi:hypothetical protein